MEFNALIEMRIYPILRKYGFKVAEEFRNVVRFQSSAMEVNIVFNDYDRSPLIEIGKKGDTLYPLNDDAIKRLWDFKLPIEQVTSEKFVQNLSILFEAKEGAEILNGNVKPLINIIAQQSEAYTSELLQKQVLEAASRAWNANDYAAFIENIEKIGLSKIPQSYQLKYKIAKQKL